MSTNTLNPAVAELTPRIERVAALFAKDLEAMTHEMLSANNGGVSRSGYDLACEVTFVNNLVANATKGVDGLPSEVNGWMRAEPEQCDKAKVIEEFRLSVEKAIEGLSLASDETLAKVVDSPLGPTAVIDLARILPVHIMYHSGQLNYIQTLHGDAVFHWAG